MPNPDQKIVVYELDHPDNGRVIYEDFDTMVLDIREWIDAVSFPNGDLPGPMSFTFHVSEMTQGEFDRIGKLEI